MKQRPLIFITNDDSIYAKGIKCLVSLMREFGDVVVVAPKEQQSGKSHSITAHDPLRLFNVNSEEGLQEYMTNGTPVDCVKMAMNILFTQRKPDLLVSGINHGCNASINTIYSGTMGGAFAGCAEGIPSIGFSVDSFDKDYNFSPCDDYIKDIVRDVLDNGMEEGICLNVNFPSTDIKGLKVCHQAKAYWAENFEQRRDPSDKSYYWLSGVYHCLEKSNNADFVAMTEGYVTMVPMQVDFTAYSVLDKYRTRFEK